MLPAILCIDDNMAGLYTRKLLLEAKGFRVFTAENGPAGLELANRESIDVVILDYKMPGMDGETVARKLRSDHPGIPILLLSGVAGELPESLLAIVDGYILKGGPLENLIAELERVTGTKAKPPINQPNTFDTNRKAVARATDLLQDSTELYRKSRKSRKA